jgi:hypothetical protein
VQQHAQREKLDEIITRLSAVERDVAGMKMDFAGGMFGSTT